MKRFLSFFNGLPTRKKVSLVCYSISMIISIILLIRIFDYNNSFTRVKKGQIWYYVRNEANDFIENDTIFYDVIDIKGDYYKILTRTSNYSDEDITDRNYFKKGNKLLK